ncbi:MAG: HAD-IC family P-type ATPase, partial [Anaerolineae bacterium]|nr:HAD-IC family P-type ATPase [Anaerolineae bacterium]
MQSLIQEHWHHLPPDLVLQLLDSDAERGLDIFEVRHRQERFGPNRLTPRRKKSPLVRFLLQFNNPLIYILLVAAAVTAVVKDLVDAAIILAVVFVNAVIGFIQEARAEQAIEALAETITTEATVIRAGQTRRIPATELVPGDIVVLKAGDRVPADLRLIRSRDLQIAEAVLTGESVPVQKDADLLLPPETVLGDRRNMAYASTLVTYGSGVGVVTAIGDDTEVGRISQ